MYSFKLNKLSLILNSVNLVSVSWSAESRHCRHCVLFTLRSCRPFSSFIQKRSMFSSHHCTKNCLTQTPIPPWPWPSDPQPQHRHAPAEMSPSSNSAMTEWQTGPQTYFCHYLSQVTHSPTAAMTLGQGELYSNANVAMTLLPITQCIKVASSGTKWPTIPVKPWPCRSDPHEPHQCCHDPLHVQQWGPWNPDHNSV